MKKFTLLFGSLILVLGLSRVAMAAPITGIFTMIDPGNLIGTPSGSMPAHTPFTGSISSSVSSPLVPFGEIAGTMIINPFVFFGITAYAHGYAGNPSPIDVYKTGATTYEAHMLFDWGASTNIDIITRWRKGYGDAPSDWQPGGAFPAVAFDLLDTTDWLFAMVDDDGNSISGHSMWNGPFAGFSANFDFNMIPEPSSLLLLGTGLAALIGIVRRRGKPSR